MEKPVSAASLMTRKTGTSTKVDRSKRVDAAVDTSKHHTSKKVDMSGRADTAVDTSKRVDVDEKVVGANDQGETVIDSQLQPDGSTLKTVVSFYVNQKGQHVKVTRVVRVVKRMMRVNRNVAERRLWRKFGDCEGQGVGPEPNVTHKSNERIYLDLRPRILGPDGFEETPDTKSNNILAADTQPPTIVCRYCKQVPFTTTTDTHTHTHLYIGVRDVCVCDLVLGGWGRRDIGV